MYKCIRVLNYKLMNNIIFTCFVISRACLSVCSRGRRQYRYAFRVCELRVIIHINIRSDDKYCNFQIVQKMLRPRVQS